MHAIPPPEAIALALCWLATECKPGSAGYAGPRNGQLHPAVCRFCKLSQAEKIRLNRAALAHGGSGPWADFGRLGAQARWLRIREAQKPDLLDVADEFPP